MQTWIALFRGINVGGHNSLPMKTLKELLAGLGAENIQTYIQSGNAVFTHASRDSVKLAEQISLAVHETQAFKPEVMLLTEAALNAAIDANPYPQAEADPKSLHLFFLAEPARQAKLDEIQELAKDSEAFTLTESVFYLYAPEGIGRSKLAERVERKLGVSATARNWRSVRKIQELTEQ
ncbi:DUF1697 domain-containing protein [Saccharospirillum mangrovi]|uniref:DUF1697 domain-containing protein n=1 Tax=Saccharospirillum mangrovi TaxID=2161747 RepID=UPI000D3B3A99|nr:DUF1697 domain-containing protein [Saccharospirillum mangrovi]